jgi:hypothetical protein
MVETSKFCSICGVNAVGYGNNAQPINNGLCCDVCNELVVIPERVRRIHRGETAIREVRAPNTTSVH